MSEIQGNSLVTDTNSQTDTDCATSIKQYKDDPVFKNSQSKCEDIFNKSLSKRAASVVGDITKGFFKEFFGVKFKEGAIPEEDISSKQNDMSKGNNVSKGVTMKKALKGTAGTFLALPFLIGMGPLYIANMIRFAAKKEEDIYAYELNKLLQSRNANDKKQAISHLSKMLAKNENIFAEDKQSIKYDVAQNFLSNNAEQIVACLDPKHPDLCAKTISFLIEISNNDSYSFCNIIGRDKAFSENIVKCLDTENPDSRAAAINLLTRMLENENENVKGTAYIFLFNGELQKSIIGCLGSYSSDLSIKTIALLTEISDKNPSSFCNIISKDKTLSGNIVKCLNPENQDLCGGTIDLLINVLGSKHTDVKSAARRVFYNDKDFFKQIIRCSESKDPGLKNNAIALLKIVNGDSEKRRLEKEKSSVGKSKE